MEVKPSAPVSATIRAILSLAANQNVFSIMTVPVTKLASTPSVRIHVQELVELMHNVKCLITIVYALVMRDTQEIRLPNALSFLDPSLTQNQLIHANLHHVEPMLSVGLRVNDQSAPVCQATLELHHLADQNV